MKRKPAPERPFDAARTAILTADVVVTFGRDGIYVIKDRQKENRKLDLAGLLEIAFQYQEETFKPLVQTWIDKLKLYRPFI